MNDAEARVAKAKITDQELLEALEEAEEEHGSLADALRHAVSTAYVSDGETDESTGNANIPVKALTGYQELVEWAGVGERLEFDTATSILANKLNIPKEGVKSRVIKPLVGANLVWKDWGYEEVWIVIGNRDGTPLASSTEPDAPTTSSETATDGGEAREKLDKLAAAVDGGESA